MWRSWNLANFQPYFELYLSIRYVTTDPFTSFNQKLLNGFFAVVSVSWGCYRDYLAQLYNQSRAATAAATTQAEQLNQVLHNLKETQAQLIQTEKMSSLGQLVARVAHEINNPVNFIYGNLTHVNEYILGLLELVELYQKSNANLTPEVQAHIEAIDLDFMTEDLPKILVSMKMGANRIREIVLSLRNFSRLDEADMKPVNIHEGIDSTLLILQNRFK